MQGAQASWGVRGTVAGNSHSSEAVLPFFGGLFIVTQFALYPGTGYPGTLVPVYACALVQVPASPGTWVPADPGTRVLEELFTLAP
eukprot:559661-Rhodomonas_salina.1